MKRELLDETSRGLAVLRGKTVSAGPRGSAGFLITMEILRFNQLTPSVEAGKGDVLVDLMDADALEGQRDRARLPDAVFLVSSLPSPLARHLARDMAYGVAPLPFAEAFALDAHADRFEAAPGADAREQIEKMHFHEALIPAYTYGREPGVPAQPTRTLGTRLLLVANEGVDPAAVELLVDVVYKSNFARIAIPRLDAQVLQLPPEFAWHRGTTAYMEHRDPLATGKLIDGLEKWTSALGAVLGGIFFVVQWVRQRYKQLRDVGFESYMSRILQLEQRTVAIEAAGELDVAELFRMQADLASLKTEAMQRFTSGEIEEPELLTGFLAQATDARNDITRLILYARKQVEATANARKKSAAAMWVAATSRPPPPLDVSGEVAPILKVEIPRIPADLGLDPARPEERED